MMIMVISAVIVSSPRGQARSLAVGGSIIGGLYQRLGVAGLTLVEEANMKYYHELIEEIQSEVTIDYDMGDSILALSCQMLDGLDGSWAVRYDRAGFGTGTFVLCGLDSIEDYQNKAASLSAALCKISNHGGPTWYRDMGARIEEMITMLDPKRRGLAMVKSNGEYI